MKMRNLFLLLTLLGVTMSCSNEQDVSLTQGGHPGEIQIMFNGNGTQTEYPGTRAIATDSENTIDDLDVYIFAATTEAGPYYFVEKWSKGASDDVSAKTFTLQGAGANRKASIFPTEFKLYPYLRLYCVANAKQIYDNTGAQLTFNPLTTDANGNVTVGSATPDVGVGTVPATTVGIKNALLGKIQAGTPILTPLPMSGMASTIISSDYSLITVEMVRRVARFDIVNDAMTSNLTIEKITPLNARASFPLFKEDWQTTNIIPVQDKYPTIDYTTLPNANKGTTQGAFYAFPTKDTDQMQVLIEGRYSGTPVSYYVKVATTPEPTVTVPIPTPKYIEVKTNNRYTLRIKDVREAGINVLFDIEDWTSGGGMIIKPDNNILPVVNEVVNLTTPVVTNAATAHIDDTLHIKDNGKFTIEATANGITNATITPIGVDKITWFTQVLTAAELPANNVVMTPEGLKKTKLTFSTQSTNLAPTAGQKALLTLYNQSASKDSILERTYIVALPEIDVLHVKYQDVNPYKNYVDNTDPANPILYQYQVTQNTSLVLDVDEYTALQHTARITSDAAAGITTVPTYAAATKKLTITSANPVNLTDQVGMVELVNKGDDTKITRIKIVRVPVTVTPSTTESNVTITQTTNEYTYTATVDVDAMKNPTVTPPADSGTPAAVDEGEAETPITFDITIASKEGVKPPAQPAANSWVKSIVEKTAFDKDKGETVYTVTLNPSGSATANVALSFAQEITGATALSLTLIKKTTAP